MDDRHLKIAVGCMLHDIGKVLYRGNDERNHSLSGYEFLRDEIGITDLEILNQLRYHHAALLKDADISVDSLAYISYMADTISAAADRCDNNTEQIAFDKTVALESIFNILNGNQQKAQYHPTTLEPNGTINYPDEKPTVVGDGFYQKIWVNLKENLDVLRNMDTIPEGYINSLLDVLEANLSYIPSSTSKKELADIALYDHAKLTAAIGTCIAAYLDEKGETDLKRVLFTNGKAFHSEKAFLLFGMDMSGIQAFIYHQYGTEDVLKNLRARSFYLEIMMENMVDELLDRTGLCRANLIYSGGGHAYLLLPNTEKIKNAVAYFEKETNDWMLDEYGNELYLACGYAEGCANDLKNLPAGSYQDLFHRVSNHISSQKRRRYSADNIRLLNRKAGHDHARECKVCHRSDHLTEEDLCEICGGLKRLSNGILEKEFFTIHKTTETGEGIPIWKDERLYCDSGNALRQKIKTDPIYVRSYAKNKLYTGEFLATKLWVGDYSSDKTISELVDKGSGIRRMGVLRADIDNLGQAFVAGFPAEYQTLSRSAAFSRKLSLFFKLHINDLLKNPEFSLDGKPVRNAAIIYSGGDDIFIIGAWKDILEFSIDLYYAVKRYTQKSLTFSAGFGMYREKYPISYIAEDTGRLEDRSKREEGKNAITLLEAIHAEDSELTMTWHWEEFITQVIGEKYSLISSFFISSSERGKNFLYNILELYRNRSEKINLARFAYLLTRMEPDRSASEAEQKWYQEFAKKMYRWRKNEKDSSQVIMAIYLYAYCIREREEDEYELRGQ